MRKIGKLLVLTCLASLAKISTAQTLTLTIQEDLSSKLPTGTSFTAKDSVGKVYHGHVVTHPARRLLRRGSMLLVFDDPVSPVTRDPEGKFRAGNKNRLIKLGSSVGAAKLADDAVDTSIGATKARYVALIVAATLIIFQKGGEAKLRKGDAVEVEPRREKAAQEILALESRTQNHTRRLSRSRSSDDQNLVSGVVAIERGCGP